MKKNQFLATDKSVDIDVNNGLLLAACPSSLELAWVIDSRNGDTLSLFEPPR